MKLLELEKIIKSEIGTENNLGLNILNNFNISIEKKIKLTDKIENDFFTVTTYNNIKINYKNYDKIDCSLFNIINDKIYKNY